MLKTIIAGLLAIMFVSSANAATDKILKTGDVLNVEEGVTLTRWSVRTALREYGYRNFGPGSLRGNIISITAYGPDDQRYLIKVHWKTYLVTHVSTPRNFWY